MSTYGPAAVPSYPQAFKASFEGHDAPYFFTQTNIKNHKNQAFCSTKSSAPGHDDVPVTEDIQTFTS